MLNKLKNKWIILLAAVGMLGGAAKAQTPTNQDCAGAIPLCQNIYSTTQSYGGAGNFPNEINQNSSCLLSGEKNDVWYVFTVQTSGMLNFTITPNDSTNDYDWAIFNLTNNTCADIYNDPALQVSCNYSPNITNKGCKGKTGPNNDTLPPCGNMAKPAIPVTAGQTFVINVSNFSSSQSGYSIDFSQATAQLYDNIQPKLALPLNSTIPCNSSTIQVNFSENVLCSSIKATDFVVTGPGGNYTISSLTSVNCAAGATYDKNFTVTISPAASTTGQYCISLASVAQVKDLCGNIAQCGPGSTQICYTVTGVTVSTTQNDVTCNGGNDGSATVYVNGGTSPYTFSWSNGGGNVQSISNLTAGIYIVKAISSEGCSAIDTVVIKEGTGLVVQLNKVDETCKGDQNGSATLNVSGGVSPYSFVWNPLGSTTTTLSNLPSGNYTVVVTEANGCTTSKSVTISQSAPLVADFKIAPSSITLMENKGYFTDMSIGTPITWTWLVDSVMISTDSYFNHEFNSIGIYYVTLIVQNIKGCTDTITKMIDVGTGFIYYVPNSFTPNGDNLNDVFTPIVWGIQNTGYEFRIYDRWGNVVFETNTPGDGWDAKTSGDRIVVTDAYIWELVVKDNKNVSHRYIGHVNVVK